MKGSQFLFDSPHLLRTHAHTHARARSAERHSAGAVYTGGGGAESSLLRRGTAGVFHPHLQAAAPVRGPELFRV